MQFHVLLQVCVKFSLILMFFPNLFSDDLPVWGKFDFAIWLYITQLKVPD